MNDLKTLMDRAMAAAFAAGREILDVYSRPINVELKDDRSPLTEADKRAHAAIAKELARTGLPLLSEEGKALPAAERQTWGMYWLVDPLDGTKEFIKRNGEFTVNIALMARDGEPAGALGSHRPVAGVLYVPVKDILYFAWQGGGSYRMEKGLRFTCRHHSGSGVPGRAAAHGGQSRVLHHRGQPLARLPETDAYIKEMEQKHGKVETVSMGSALKICLVAEGAADAYPRYAPTMEWDTAAGHAIVEEAGRKLSDVSTGAAMRYNKHELVNQWFIVE
jgi:3'(2'), 5'-bisphosphate nucleotidase